jgi:predicted small secreted protein
METALQLSRSKIIFFLIIIIGISLGLKLYTTDFSLPVNSDNLLYTLHAVAHTNGDFSTKADIGMGWSLFVSPFFSIIDSDNFIDYSNTIRVISLSLATCSIPVMYTICRKFFDYKYSLVGASLFAFEPHLNYNAGTAFTEPLFIITILSSFYFVLSKNTKYIIPSLILAGAVYWIRPNGFIIFLIITIIYFITLRGQKHYFRNYALGLTLFLIVISPVLLQKYEQFGDPFYSHYSERIFAGSYEKLAAENTAGLNPTMMYYIENEGLGSLLENYILKGFYNVFVVLSKISLPYLFILIPFGILFSFRAFGQDRNYVRANWIFILLSIASMLIVIAVIPERRFLYFLLPFLIIFSVIPIQRVVEYGLSTFSFTKKQKNVFLIIVILIVIILASCFTIFGFGKPDVSFENEKKDFAKFVINDLHGTILREFGPATDYVAYQIITEPAAQFKQYKINSEWKDYQELDENEDGFTNITIYGESLGELVENGKEFELKYIIAKKEKNFYPFLSDLYSNEENYSYMIKVFDSKDLGYKKLEVKVFEINYEKFNNNE